MANPPASWSHSRPIRPSLVQLSNPSGSTSNFMTPITGPIDASTMSVPLAPGGLRPTPADSLALRQVPAAGPGLALFHDLFEQVLERRRRVAERLQLPAVPLDDRLQLLPERVGQTQVRRPDLDPDRVL